MKRKFIVCVLAFTLVVLSSVLPFVNDVSAMNDFSAFNASLAGAQFMPSAASSKGQLSEAEQKLSTKLLGLTDSQLGFTTAGGDIATEGIEYVYIQLKDGHSFSNVKALVDKVENVMESAGLMSAWVDINDLTQIAQLDEVRSIREVLPPVVNTGTYLSEGDILHRADIVRGTYGADGTGVKIGIISDGVDSLASAVATGDLPGNVTVLSNTIGGDEGTAMLEILHDLAPGASLYFHDHGIDTIAFCDAIQALADAGCDIICDDIAWIAQPYFEDGTIATYLTDLLATTDIVYTTSAGNQAEEHYQGQYSSYQGGTFHRFYADGVESNAILVNLNPGGSVISVLQWDDAFGSSSNDYDFYGYVYRNNVWELEWGSIATQDGSGDPLEIDMYTNESDTAEVVCVAIDKYNATGNEILEMFLYCSGGSIYSEHLKYMSPVDAIYGHAAVPDAITCGAVHPDDPNSIAYYSSQGPVTHLSGTRQKPDICGLSGVEISGAGGFGSYNSYNGKYYFYGTSASSPHIAAVAGLLRSKYPAMDSNAIRALLLNNSDDLGVSGYDNVFGYGRADAVESVLGVNPKDVNYDGYVDLIDVTALGQKFNTVLGDEGFNTNHDFNSDNIINIYDLVSIAREIQIS